MKTIIKKKQHDLHLDAVVLLGIALMFVFALFIFEGGVTGAVIGVDLEIQSSGVTYYVDATLGNDSWNGNITGGDFLPDTCEDDGNSSDCTDGPWQTVPYAINNITTNSTINIKNGTYNLSGYSKDINYSLSLLGEDRDSTILIEGDRLTFNRSFTLKNLSFVNWSSTIAIRPSAGPRELIDGILIDNCKFENVIRGIHSYESVGNITNVNISNSYFLNLSTSPHGIRLISDGGLTNVVLINNNFTDLHGGGSATIAAYVGSDGTRNVTSQVTIYNNTCFNITSNEVDEIEVHCILAYGDEINVSDNNIQYLDAGTDHEAIYLKANHSTIANNYLYEVGSKGGGGDISIKGYENKDANVNNTIINNTIITNLSGVRSMLIQGGARIIDNYIVKPDGHINVYAYNNSVNISGNIVEANTTGMILHELINSEISNNVVSSNSGYGVHFYLSQNNIIASNLVTSNSSVGIYLQSSCNNNLTLNNGTSNSGIGIYLRSSSNSIFTSNRGISNSSVGIYLQSSNNTFEQTRAESVQSGDYAIYLRDTANNLIQDCINISGVSGDVYVYSDANNTNNTFLNCSYDIAKESVNGAPNYLTRKWHYQAYVNNSLGSAVSSANVTAYNVSGIQEFNVQTNASGWIAKTAITDYVNTGGTRSYFSNYTVNASHDDYILQDSNFLNITSTENKLDGVLTLGTPIVTESPGGGGSTPSSSTTSTVTEPAPPVEEVGNVVEIPEEETTEQPTKETQTPVVEEPDDKLPLTGRAFFQNIKGVGKDLAWLWLTLVVTIIWTLVYLWKRKKR